MSTPATTWKQRHFDAIANPSHEELPVVLLMEAAVYLSERHSEDMVLGPAAVHVLMALRVLLDGPLGRLDGGTIDGFIRNYLIQCGVDPDTERQIEADDGQP